MLEFVIEYKFYIGYIFEILAASAGSYFLYKTPNVPKDLKYFSWFLWYVFVLDFSSLYALWAFFDDYKTFPFLKNSLFTRNIWMHNWNHLISISFFSYFFINQFKNMVYKRIFKITLLLFILFGVIQLSSSNQVFLLYNMSILLIGVLLLTITIGIYYYELLLSDHILVFTKNMYFYISIGLLIWHLCVPPVHIYSAYFSIENIEFIKLHAAIIRYSNIFMYGIIAFGFIYCIPKKIIDIK